jgi:hypothetical protein
VINDPYGEFFIAENKFFSKGMLPSFTRIMSSSNLLLDAYNLLTFYRRTSRMGLLASLQIFLEQF